MRTAVLPSLRVDAALCEAPESVLQDGEMRSSFVEQSLRAQVRYRRQQEALIARGLASREHTQTSGRYIAAEEVLSNLQSRLSAAQKS